MNLMERSTAAGYGEPLSREQNLEIYKRLKTDPSAREEMITGNMALSMVKVDALLREVPSMGFYREDLVSVALLAITTAVDGLIESEREVTNPTGYIYRAIENALRQEVDEESAVSVSWKTQKRYRDKDGEYVVPATVSDKDALAVFGALEAPNELLVDELKEEIEACCQDETDLKIVRMRADGYTDQEISQATGINDATISYRGKRIEERFLNRCPEYRRRG